MRHPGKSHCSLLRALLRGHGDPRGGPAWPAGRGQSSLSPPPRPLSSRGLLDSCTPCCQKGEPGAASHQSRTSSSLHLTSLHLPKVNPLSSALGAPGIPCDSRAPSPCGPTCHPGGLGGRRKSSGTGSAESPLWHRLSFSWPPNVYMRGPHTSACNPRAQWAAGGRKSTDAPSGQRRRGPRHRLRSRCTQSVPLMLHSELHRLKHWCRALPGE